MFVDDAHGAPPSDLWVLGLSQPFCDVANAFLSSKQKTRPVGGGKVERWWVGGFEANSTWDGCLLDQKERHRV